MPALVAASGVCGLAAMPASALELGELQVNSALGQPLRASIAYALNPTEQIHDYCIYLRSGTPTGDLPALSDARISITGDRINVTGNAPIREPLLSMQVVVDCAYTPHLLREYMLMIDPIAPRVAAAPVFAGTAIEQSSPEIAQTSNPRRNQTSLRARSAPAGSDNSLSPVQMGGRYRVQPGDTISTIVARIENRDIGLWAAVDIVFAANPDGFIDGNVNQLLAGYELFIPSLTEVSNSAMPAATASATTASDFSSPAATMTDDVTTTTVAPAVPAINDTPPVVDIQEAPVNATAPAMEAVIPVTGQPVDLKPGDVVLTPIDTSDNSAVSTAPGVDQVVTSAPVVDAAPAETGINNAWNWLLWLGGTGVALILGLLLFGRSLKERFGLLGGGASVVPGRRQDDDPTVQTKIATEVDYDFEDTINAEAISLDADLEVGTGFNTSGQIIVAEEFGFTANERNEDTLDLEITEEAAREPEVSPTDIIPPNHREEMSSILEKEEIPVSDDEDYDMSMIVDATKQSLDEFDATAKDLRAVQVSNVDSKKDDQEYTINSAADFQTLEQDYQEEFTATQAANAEIERVAMELANRMAEEEAGDATHEMPVGSSPTEELSGADLTAELAGPDVTRELPQFELPDVSDSDITAELTANLPTSIEAENDADVVGDGSDMTVEMSAAGSDITVEMQVESGKVDTKKK